tara:strand:+ start:169 stop:438 length:270 start_codon:yes stop_codon:yes gene_type:complete
MSKGLSTILVEKGYSPTESKLDYKLVKKQYCVDNNDSICVEVKSVKDVIGFLNYLKVSDLPTEKEIDSLYFKDDTLKAEDSIYLNLEIL